MKFDIRQSRLDAFSCPLCSKFTSQMPDLKLTTIISDTLLTFVRPTPTRCDQTLENEHFPCPCNQPISLLSDDEEEESSQTLMWGGQILRAEAPLATDRRQCHGCFVSGGVQLEASACPNCGIDLTPRRTRTGHLMSPQSEDAIPLRNPFSLLILSAYLFTAEVVESISSQLASC